MIIPISSVTWNALALVPLETLHHISELGSPEAAWHPMQKWLGWDCVRAAWVRTQAATQLDCPEDGELWGKEAGRQRQAGRRRAGLSQSQQGMLELELNAKERSSLPKEKFFW